MRNHLVLTASVFLAGASALPAHAQWDNGYDGSVVRCESRDGRTERCNAGGGDVRLVRQLSDSPCVRGRNWGTDSRGIWVSSGCRAEFQVQSGYYDDDDRYGGGYGNDYYGNGEAVFRCESSNGRTERCASAGGRAEFVRQLSNTPCVRGQSWGSDSRGVWVSNGCRALFRTGGYYGSGQYGSDLLRCESRDNRSHNCSFSGGRRGEIRLLRQLSGKPCIENQTWGRSRTGVWVTQGCRAEFVLGRGNGGGYPYPRGGNLSTNPNPHGNLSTNPNPHAGLSTNPRPPVETVVERPRSTGGSTQPQTVAGQPQPAAGQQSRPVPRERGVASEVPR